MKENRNHWEALGAEYSQGWASPCQQKLSQMEVSFVTDHLPQRSGMSVLDVGIGNGRILDALLARNEVEAVYGVDIAPQMVDHCRARLAGNTKVKELFVCDIAREPLPVPIGLHFVSAIRMLKYSPNWWEIVQRKLLAHLAVGGVLVFSMANAASVKRFSRPYAVEYFKTTEGELRQRLKGVDLELLEISGFSKVPDVFYRRCRRPVLTNSLLAVERKLDRAIGSSRLARELFVAARRKT